LEHKCKTCDHIVSDTDNYKELTIELKIRTDPAATFCVLRAYRTP
jgi:hypothetical protein